MNQHNKMDIHLTETQSKAIADLASIVTVIGFPIALFMLWDSVRKIKSDLEAQTDAIRRQTLIVINDAEKADLQLKAMKVINSYKDDPQKIGELANARSKKQQKAAKKLRRLLNHYEALAVGIRAGALDGELLRLLEKSTIRKLYYGALPFIQAVRKEDETRHNRSSEFYRVLEALVCEWDVLTKA